VGALAGQWHCGVNLPLLERRAQAGAGLEVETALHKKAPEHRRTTLSRSAGAKLLARARSSGA